MFKQRSIFFSAIGGLPKMASARRIVEWHINGNSIARQYLLAPLDDIKPAIWRRIAFGPEETSQ
jgi:hypothetical protein